MKKELISPVVKASVTFGYEIGFTQAVSYMKEAAGKLDGDQDMKLMILSALGSIEEFGQEDKIKLVNSLEFEPTVDGSVSFL